MINFEYLELPALPPELIPEIYKSIEINPDLFPKKCDYYTIHNGTSPLYDFVRPYFNNIGLVQVQKFLGGYSVPIHTDQRRNSTCNYIVSTGGTDVLTNWYRPNIDNELDLIESHKIEPFRWHRINVTTLHNITGTIAGQSRIALCVFHPN